MPQYLAKDILLCTIWVIYLEIDFSEKLNLNLRYLLTRVANLDNQYNALYNVFFNKLIETL